MIKTEKTVDVWTTCKCGQTFAVKLAEAVAADDMLRGANLRLAVCSDCEAKAARETARKAAERKERERLGALNQTYDKRRKESRLDDYYLGWDEQHPGANPALQRWMELHWQTDSMLIVGNSGEAKTRLVQYYAYRYLQCRGAVYFCKAAQLVDELAALFKSSPRKGREAMIELYHYDLIIIDDFGKEVLSESRNSKIFDLVDMRYTATERARNIASGKWNPLFSRPNGYGAQIWVTTNDSSLELLERLGANGVPALRRLRDMCAIWPVVKAGQQ